MHIVIGTLIFILSHSLPLWQRERERYISVFVVYIILLVSLYIRIHYNKPQSWVDDGRRRIVRPRFGRDQRRCIIYPTGLIDDRLCVAPFFFTPPPPLTRIGLFSISSFT